MSWAWALNWWDGFGGADCSLWLSHLATFCFVSFRKEVYGCVLSFCTGKGDLDVCLFFFNIGIFIDERRTSYFFFRKVFRAADISNKG